MPQCEVVVVLRTCSLFKRVQARSSDQAEHRSRQRLGHFNAVHARRHDPARIARAFTGGVQATHVDALVIAPARDAQWRRGARFHARQHRHSALPDYAIDAIREALPAFERQIKGFSMPDAVLTGVETRTSSPLRITRGRDFQSMNVRGLYPAGEGAGYAGGIMSAGVDGIEVAEALARSLLGIAAD